jgi:hypothetical protein
MCGAAGRLLDGCSHQQRSQLLPGLPTLSFCDLHGQGGSSGGGGYGGRSSSSPQEAGLVGQLVSELLARGLAPRQVGVICFFRAQVALVQQQLAQQLGRGAGGGCGGMAGVVHGNAQQGQEQQQEEGQDGAAGPAQAGGAVQVRSGSLTLLACMHAMAIRHHG